MTLGGLPEELLVLVVRHLPNLDNVPSEWAVLQRHFLCRCCCQLKTKCIHCAEWLCPGDVCTCLWKYFTCKDSITVLRKDQCKGVDGVDAVTADLVIQRKRCYIDFSDRIKFNVNVVAVCFKNALTVKSKEQSHLFDLKEVEPHVWLGVPPRNKGVPLHPLWKHVGQAYPPYYFRFEAEPYYPLDQVEVHYLCYNWLQHDHESGYECLRYS